MPQNFRFKVTDSSWNPITWLENTRLEVLSLDWATVYHDNVVCVEFWRGWYGYNSNLEAWEYMGAFYANDVSAIPQVQDFVKGSLDIVAWWGWGITIDYTKSHEEILKKYDETRDKEFDKIIKNIPTPKIDVSKIDQFLEMLRKKEENDTWVDISPFTNGISNIKTFIETLSKEIAEKYAKKVSEIEIKYNEEIQKKNSIIRENQYTLTEGKKYINLLKDTVTKLEKRLKDIEDEHEDELKEMEEGYKVAIKQEKERTEMETKDKIRKDVLSSIE